MWKKLFSLSLSLFFSRVSLSKQAACRSSQNAEGRRRCFFIQQTVQPKSGDSWAAAASWEAGGKAVLSLHPHEPPHPAGTDSWGARGLCGPETRLMTGCSVLSSSSLLISIYWCLLNEYYSWFPAKEWKCSSAPREKMSFCYRCCKVKSAVDSDGLISWINSLEWSAVKVLWKDI